MKRLTSRRDMLKIAGSVGAASLLYACGGTPPPGQLAVPTSRAVFYGHATQAASETLSRESIAPANEAVTGKTVLIVYASRTGNTEKVAYAFHDAFSQAGWSSDIFKVSGETDTSNPPFNFADYDALFAGSGTYMRLPYDEITQTILRQFAKTGIGERKVVPGPKIGVAFATNGGAHLGSREAEANLKLLEIEFEHLGFKGVGAFSCPGSMGGASTPEWYWGDISDRPNEQDLTDAAAFVKQFLQLDEVKEL